MRQPAGARSSRRATTTALFGAGRRESHDASRFYGRFEPPILSSEASVAESSIDGLFIRGDARSMGDEIPDASVALVVTSPPYFAGKEYEAALGAGAVPGSYLEYLAMLGAVFERCVRKLEPGGRIAVNVANLGRRPYRSLSSDVIRILQDDLGLLLRGEVIWVKGKGQSGSCAWGSFASASNPVLRDVSERVIVASKGRFDRAGSRRSRSAAGLPSADTIAGDEFMEATLDVWEIPPESARRVGHPAPFPVELPQRLIELYTYERDLVLDPFLGAGSTAVAAARTRRRVAGYDLDPGYLEIARARFATEKRAAAMRDHPAGKSGVAPPPQRRTGFRAAAAAEVARAGFTVAGPDRRMAAAGASGFTALDAAGKPWYFDVCGAFSLPPNGLARSEALWRFLGRAASMRARGVAPLVALTSQLPPARGEPGRALRALGPESVFDVLAISDPDGLLRLRDYAAGGCKRPLPGFWGPDELPARG